MPEIDWFARQREEYCLAEYQKGLDADPTYVPTMGATVHRPLPKRDPSQVPVYALGLAIRNPYGLAIQRKKGLALLGPRTSTPHTPASPRNTPFPARNRT